MTKILDTRYKLKGMLEALTTYVGQYLFKIYSPKQLKMDLEKSIKLEDGQ